MLSNCLWALPTHSPNRPTYFRDDSSSFDPCDPCFSWREALNWRIGYYGDFVYNREMKRRRYGHQAGIVERVAFTTNGGTLTVNAADWFEFFTMLGTTKFFIRTPNKEEGGESLTLFSPSFSWSIGMRGTIWKYRDLAFGFSGQYFRTYTRANSFLDYRGGTSTFFNDNSKRPFYEWMASFGTSYTFSGTTMSFIPHAALTAS